MDEPKMYKCKLGEACTCKHQPHQYKVPCPNYEKVTLTNTPRPGETPAQIAARLRLPFGRCEACGEEHQHPFIAAAAELDTFLFDRFAGKPGVPERLEGLGDLYRERNATYGDNYKHFGPMMVGLFPRGITVRTADEHNRFALFVHLATKLSRYAQQFDMGGHYDSLNDISVYAQMLQEVDLEIKDRGDAS